jgi:hypothetical protein
VGKIYRGQSVEHCDRRLRHDHSCVADIIGHERMSSAARSAIA